MRYFLAIICPPLAVLLCGKIFQFLFLSLPLSTLGLFFFPLGLIPALIHALCVVSSHLADKRTQKIVDAVDRKDRYSIKIKNGPIKR